MIGSEVSLWRWLINGWKVIPRTQLHCHRVENAAGSGMPDVEGFYNSQFWLELKCSPLPINGGPVDVGHLRPKQIEWLHNRWLVGGNAWILLRVEGKGVKNIYLISGQYARNVKAGLTQFELAQLSYLTSLKPHPLEVLRASVSR